MIPSVDSIETLQREIIRRDIAIRAIEQLISELRSDNKNLESLVSQKNAQVVRLEAENVRLKMVRTDKDLQAQADGLRKEVGAKDRELVDLKRQIARFQENEKIQLGRTVAAEQKTVTLQNTLTTMQTARDESERRASASADVARESERLVVEAAARAKTAQDDAKMATKPFERLLTLAEAVVLKSPSLNRNETEVKSFRTALELFRKSKGQVTG